jgi:hypothetical protein
MAGIQGPRGLEGVRGKTGKIDCNCKCDKI